VPLTGALGAVWAEVWPRYGAGWVDGDPPPDPDPTPEA
jgi:hypothetical protein